MNESFDTGILYAIKANVDASNRVESLRNPRIGCRIPLQAVHALDAI